MTYTLNITKCPRCDGNHKRLVFKPFKQAVSQYTHWALCPVTQEPLLTGYASFADLPLLQKHKREGRKIEEAKPKRRS